MSLLDGLIYNTFTKETSNHSLLMRFYELDNLIEERLNTVSKPFHDLPLYLMNVEAQAILKRLNII